MDSTDLRLYVLDTNVLIHDPQAPLNFQEHVVVIPLTVLEELDHLKTSKQPVAAEARQAIRLIDKLLGDTGPNITSFGAPIERVDGGTSGWLRVLMPTPTPTKNTGLEPGINDNKIINAAISLRSMPGEVILVTKDINMRLKARACGLKAEDYHTDRLVDDVALLPKGFHQVIGSFWDYVAAEGGEVATTRGGGSVYHAIHGVCLSALPPLLVNQFVLDDTGFVGQVRDVSPGRLLLADMHQEPLVHLEAWGLKPRDIYQALALHALLDPDIHLVSLTGAAGSGKTILALAAAIEQAMVMKRFRHIIVTRSVQNLDEEIGFLPGTETEKMLPWLGAITDNLEALHLDDHSPSGSIEYLLGKVPIQFKSLNYIRGRSFQQSLIIVDECQNLTPHQMKTIITRAGQGSKVVCLGNLAQIDTPYLSAPSSGLTYLTERFKNCPLAAHITLQGVPRSALAEFAEAHL